MAVDKNIVALAALTAPIGTDICYVVDDPGVTPLDRKITLSDLGKGLNASNIPNTPAGTVAATNVQAAINELDTEKLAKAGGSMTDKLGITIANTVNNIGLTVTQNDVTNNPAAATITNIGSGHSLLVTKNNVSQTGFLARFTDITGGVDTQITDLGRSPLDTAGSNQFYRNLGSAATSGPLVKIYQDNAEDNQPALTLVNDGTGNGIFLDQNGAGVALNIDSEATTVDHVAIAAGTARTAGYLINISDAHSSSTADSIGAVSNNSGSWLTLDKNVMATEKPAISMDIDIAGTGAGKNLYGIKLDFDRTGDLSSGVGNLFGYYATPTNTGASAGTHNTYAFYGEATGDTGGTSTAIGGYFSATGADTNHAVKTGGDIFLTDGTVKGGGIQMNQQTLAADTNLTLDKNDGLVAVTLGSTSDNTITLPACSGNQGMIVHVYITDGTGTNNAVVTRAGADTISNGSADLSNTTVTLGDTGDFVEFRCVNSSTWTILYESGTVVA